MKAFEKGFKEAVEGIIAGIMFSSILTAFKKDDLVSSDMVFLFTCVGVLGEILTISSFKTAGTVFTLGWIFGAWLLKDMLEPFDFIVFLVVPIAVLAIRVGLFIKKMNSGS